MSRDLLRMARAYHDEMQVPWSLNEQGFLAAMDEMARDGFVRVTDKGFIAGVIGEHRLSQSWKVATQVFWYGDADLIRQFRKWAKAQGADEIHVSCRPNSRVEAFYSSFSAPCDAVYSEVT